MSIESKHTPGPWRVDLAAYYPGTTSWLSIYCSSQSGPLAFVGGTPATDECRANAHLFAAAPDLLEAAQVPHACGEPEKVSMFDEEGVEGWRWVHPDGREWFEMGSWDEPPPMHPMMAEAIAKATGSEQK